MKKSNFTSKEEFLASVTDKDVADVLLSMFNGNVSLAAASYFAGTRQSLRGDAVSQDEPPSVRIPVIAGRIAESMNIKKEEYEVTVDEPYTDKDGKELVDFTIKSKVCKFAKTVKGMPTYRGCKNARGRSRHIFELMQQQRAKELVAKKNASKAKKASK